MRRQAPCRAPLLLAVVTLLLSVSAAGASLRSRGGTGQMETGVVYARYSLDGSSPGSESTPRAGLLLGASITVPCTRALALRAGLGYERRKARIASSFTPMTQGFELGGTAVLEDHLQYLTVPLTIEASLLKTALHPYLRVGAEAAFLVSGRRHTEFNSEADRIVEDESVEQWRSDTSDLDLLLGLGAKPRAWSPLFVELRYVHGLRSASALGAWTKHRALVGVLGTRLF